MQKCRVVQNLQHTKQNAARFSLHHFSGILKATLLSFHSMQNNDDCGDIHICDVDTMLDRCTIEMALGAVGHGDISNRANLNKSSPATRAYQEPTPGPRQQHLLTNYLPITPEEASATTYVEALTNGANSEDTEQSS
uniref:Uncharacterized protein n=1 Tax=Glossina austeni TaxID=7395 RepID=A0A1A9UD61_GLOAU